MACAAIYETTTPYLASDLALLDFEQTADIVYLAHSSYAPEKLARYADTDWRLGPVTFGATTIAPAGLGVVPTTPTTSGWHPISINYVVTTIDAVSGQESLPSVSAAATNDLSLAGNFNTITWLATPDAQTGVTRYAIYKKSDGVYGYIGATTDLTFKDDNIAADGGTTPPNNKNPFDGPNNYPGKVSLYQQRAIWARTNNAPSAVFTSGSADLENLNVSVPPRASDAITFQLVARRVNSIQHLVPLKQLLALTSDSVFAISGGTNTVLTPTTINPNTEGYRGASTVRPATVDDIAFFVTARGAALRSLGYTFEIDGYKGDDLTVFAPHFFKGYTIVDMDWAEYPTSTLWCVRSDGVLLALTWQAEQDVWGWSLCETDGFVESCCVISDSGEDRLYCVIRRTINGLDHRYVERMATYLWERGQAVANFLDCSRTYSGTPTTHISGLGYLEGKTVYAVADGFLVRDLVVANGSITLTNAASVVTVGLPYDAMIETLPVVIQTGPNGSIQGRKQQTGRAMIMVQNTTGLQSGASDDELFLCRPRSGEDYDQADSLFTGFLEGDTGAQWKEGATFCLWGTPGLPFNVLGVFGDYEIGG